MHHPDELFFPLSFLFARPQGRSVLLAVPMFARGRLVSLSPYLSSQPTFFLYWLAAHRVWGRVRCLWSLSSEASRQPLALSRTHWW